VRYDTESDELEIAGGDIRYSITSITRLTDDILWLGTTSGVVEYNVSSRNCSEYRAFVTREPLKEPSAANIQFDGDAIWFSDWSASHNGAIIRYDRRNDTWRRFTRESILGDTKTRSPTIVKRICVDDEWVWFATDHGVLQYDKLADTWRHFTTEDGLLSNNIRHVQCTASFVWICPEMRTRISKYGKKSGTWSEVKLSHLIHPRNYVYDMQTDGDAIWLTISSSGVRRISEDDKQSVYMRDDGLAQMGARWINVDEDHVWVAHWKDRGTGALSRYDKRTGEWTVYSNTDVLEGDMISRIVTGEEYTWIIYEAWREGSVTGYNRATGEWTTIKPGGHWGSQIREICEDEGYLWLAPEAGGIKRFHIASGTWTSFYTGEGPLMDFVNQRALKADDKYVWIGTPGGISRYDKEKESWTNYTKQNTLSGKSVQAVVSDDRYVWCGTSKGISRYDKAYGTWTNLSREGSPYSGMEALSWPEWKLRGRMISDNITALAVDDRFLWVATRDGAGRYDKITDRWDSYGVWHGLPGMDVTSVIVDGYDIWMGTNVGLGKFPQMSDDPNAWVSYTSGLEIKAGAMTKEYANTLVSNEVWAVAADRDYIWVGTMRGASRYNKEADTWTTYTTENGLSSNEISSICVDGSIVWFGSDKGVTAYDKETGKWTVYAAEDGLASNRITCIASDANALWFGTFDAGLTKYDKKAGTWQSYSREDGLTHDCVLSVSVDGDHIWIGTRRGLSRYDVDKSNWTTFTEYGDSEDELEMVTPSKGQVSNLPIPKKGAKPGRAEGKVSRPAHHGLEIAEISFDPAGRDEEDLNGEWVRIVNNTDAPVDITGFTLSDHAGHEYEFGELILPAASAITVFTGSGTDTASSLYWGSKTPIWNNRGDTVYLRNANGKMVDVHSY
jgi:ligand-binding sensor domain-containing protein